MVKLHTYIEKAKAKNDDNLKLHTYYRTVSHNKY